MHCTKIEILWYRQLVSQALPEFIIIIIVIVIVIIIVLLILSMQKASHNMQQPSESSSVSGSCMSDEDCFTV